MRISYSSLETFTVCPAKFKFGAIDKIKVPQSKEAFFGTIIHETLRMLHDPAKIVPPTEEEVLKYFSNRWVPEMWADKDEESIAFSQGVKILKEYYQKNYPTNFNIVDLETRFDAQVFDKDSNENHLITGKIDRIDKIKNGFEIIDYKTSKKMPPQKSIDENLQLSTYHLGIANRWPSIEEKNAKVKLSLYFLRHSEKLSTERTAEQLNETREKILRIIRQIKEMEEKEEFKPRANALCDWCGYQKWCPLFAHKFLEKKGASEEEMKKAVEEYFEIKGESKKNSRRIAELQEIINQYLDKQNLERVFIDSGYITRSEQERNSWNEEKVREILEKEKKWNEVSKLDSAKLKKILGTLPLEIQEKIRKALKVQKTFTLLKEKKTK
jgi:putative RecB family exonuclease